MKPKLATVTALLIGLLVAAVGIFPGPRKAVVSIFRGELSTRDIVWERLLPQNVGVKNSNNLSIEGGISKQRLTDELVGQGGDPASAVGRQADQLVAKSIAMLVRCRSISAKTRQTVNLYGKHLVGSGEYLEQDNPDRRAGGARMFRLELKIQVGDEPKTLLHVCDGRRLWRCEIYGGKGTAEYIDLARVAQSTEGREGPTARGPIGQWSALGGLPKLLRGLRNWFQFTAIDQAKLPPDQTPALRIQGIWRPDRLAALIPPPPPGTKPKPVSAENLPEHLPDRVVLFLSRDDLFPFRIEYHRRKPPSDLALAGDEDLVVATMDLFEVSLNRPINPLQFSFVPGKLECSDQTDRFVEQLGIKKKP